MKLGDPSGRHMERGCVAFSATEEDLGLCEATSCHTIGDGATPTTVPSSAQNGGEEECKKELRRETRLSNQSLDQYHNWEEISGEISQCIRKSSVHDGSAVLCRVRY